MSGFEFRSMSTSSPTPRSYAQIPSTSLPFATRLAPTPTSQTPISTASPSKFNLQNFESKFPIDFANFYQGVSNHMLLSSYQNLIRQNLYYQAPNNQFQFPSPVLNSFNNQVPIRQTHYESPIINHLEVFNKDPSTLNQQDLAHQMVYSSNFSSSSSISSSASSSSSSINDNKASKNKSNSFSFRKEATDGLEMEKKHIYQ